MDARRRAGRPLTWQRLALDLLAWAAHRRPLGVAAAQRLRSGDRGALAELQARGVDSLYYLAVEPDAALQRVYDKVVAAQRAALADVCGGLQAAGVGAIVFKGAEFTARWYAGRGLGYVADCDLLVRRSDLRAVKQVLYGMDYRPAVFDGESGRLVDRDVADIAAMEAAHYELAPFCGLAAVDLSDEERAAADERAGDVLVTSRGTPAVFLQFDVHHAVAVDIDSGPLFDRAVPGATAHALTLSPADHLWFTTSRYYTEVGVHGKVSLRDFAYLVPLVASGTVDWSVLVEVAHGYHLYASLWYYLAFMDRLTDGAVPSAVLDALAPTRGSRVRDWGWQLGKLFDTIEPFGWPDGAGDGGFGGYQSRGPLPEP